MIWFHGNAGNIGDRVDNIKLLHDKTRISIFIFDYRGYGRSPGSSSETTTYLDGEAAMNFVRSAIESREQKSGDFRPLPGRCGGRGDGEPPRQPSSHPWKVPSLR